MLTKFNHLASSQVPSNENDFEQIANELNDEAPGHALCDSTNVEKKHRAKRKRQPYDEPRDLEAKSSDVAPHAAQHKNDMIAQPLKQGARHRTGGQVSLLPTGAKMRQHCSPELQEIKPSQRNESKPQIEGAESKVLKASPLDTTLDGEHIVDKNVQLKAERKTPSFFNANFNAKPNDLTSLSQSRYTLVLSGRSGHRNSELAPFFDRTTGIPTSCSAALKRVQINGERVKLSASDANATTMNMRLSFLNKLASCLSVESRVPVRETSTPLALGQTAQTPMNTRPSGLLDLAFPANTRTQPLSQPKENLPYQWVGLHRRGIVPTLYRHPQVGSSQASNPWAGNLQTSSWHAPFLFEPPAKRLVANLQLLPDSRYKLGVESSNGVLSTPLNPQEQPEKSSTVASVSALGMDLLPLPLPSPYRLNYQLSPTLFWQYPQVISYRVFYAKKYYLFKFENNKVTNFLEEEYDRT